MAPRLQPQQKKPKTGTQKTLEDYMFAKPDTSAEATSSKHHQSHDIDGSLEHEPDAKRQKILEKGKEEVATLDTSDMKVKTLLPFTKSWDVEGEHNLEGWAMTFKHDGIRTYWDGKSLFDKDNTKFNTPSWFIEKFPSDMTFDGEIFAKEKLYSQTKALINSTDPEDWKMVSFHCIDVPSMASQNFLERRKSLQEVSTKINVPWFIINEPIRCKSKDHLIETLKDVTLQGGAGLLLHEPTSQYREASNSPKRYKGIQAFLKGNATVVQHTVKAAADGLGKCLTVTCHTSDDKKKVFDIALHISNEKFSKLNLPNEGDPVSIW